MRNLLLFLCLGGMLALAGCERKAVSEKCCEGLPMEMTFAGGMVALPNIFTPNGDGINERLQVFTENITEFSMTIKNSTGQKLFETNDPEDFWDGAKNGKVVRQGRKKFNIEATTTDGGVLTMEGWVCLITDDDVCISNAETCVFGDQWNGNGFDPASGEIAYSCDN